MLTDPFATVTCAETVGLLDALLRGVPEGACLNPQLTPITAFVGIAVIGIAMACLLTMARALVYGRADPSGTRRAHEPELGLRGAANRARAARHGN